MKIIIQFVKNSLQEQHIRHDGYPISKCSRNSASQKCTTSPNHEAHDIQKQIKTLQNQTISASMTSNTHEIQPTTFIKTSKIKQKLINQLPKISLEVNNLKYNASENK